MPKTHILVAEDEASVLDMCVRCLARAGYDVQGVSSGVDAIEQLRRGRYDLLLTDIRMPGMGGIEVCREIRAFNRDLAIVIMTGYGTMQFAIEALKEGVSEFVLKPFPPSDLVQVVERALAKQWLLREHARLQALVPLFDLSRVFMSSVDLQTIAEHVVRIAQEETQASSASLMLTDDSGALNLYAAWGETPATVMRSHRSTQEGVADYVVTQRSTVSWSGALQDDARFFLPDESDELGGAITAPLVHQDQLLGVLNVARGEQGGATFSEADSELLSVLASQAAIAIENARLFDEAQLAYQRLAELDRLKSEFISIASHELRHPLAVLLAYVGLVEEEATGTSREYLGQAVESALQLKSIIDDMLSLRRMDTGETGVTLEGVAVADIVDETVRQLDPLAQAKGIEISVEMPDGPIRAQADPQLLRLILSNLLSNAIKFNAPQGLVRVFGQLDDQRVVVAVEDNGPGIPPEEMERIFQRFYQIENPLRREHEGIGLGLAIVREMSELMGGRVWVESELGAGSRFYLSLPRAD